MKKIFSLFAAVLFAGSMMAEPLVLFHESFGDNSGSARAWSYDYADQSGVAAVYADVAGYEVTNAKQSKNTMGSKLSALTQTTKDVDAVLVVGPLNVSAYTSLAVTYQWKASSIKGTYSTDLYYATSASGEYTKVEGTGAGATTYVERSYSLPEAAQVATLYLKVVWNTSNTSGLIDELELTGEGEAPAVEKPAIAGETPFEDETEVTISCATDGAKIYYTLNGVEPTAASTEYTAAFKLTASATVKAIAIKGEDKSAIAEKAFTKLEKLTCAAIYDHAKGAAIALNPVTVTYANGKNVYVKDATGSMLLYLNSAGSWKAGDVLSGVKGTLDIYNNLYEVKLTDGQAAAVAATSGEAPAPEEFTAAPVAADMNKYVVVKNVSVSAATFPDNKNMNATIGEETFILRNNFNADVAFDTAKKYDITGVVAVYKTDVQVYFISAMENTATGIENTAVEAKAFKTFENGQLVIIKNGVKYDVTGAVIR